VVNIRLPYEPLYGKLLGVALHSRIGAHYRFELINKGKYKMARYKFVCRCGYTWYSEPHDNKCQKCGQEIIGRPALQFSLDDASLTKAILKSKKNYGFLGV
jgi:hypothetical protein